MKQPETESELLAMHKMLRSDPQKYLAAVNRWIGDHPQDGSAYFSRHFAWMNVGEPERALADLDKSISLEPNSISFLSRGLVYRHLGEYEKALEDYRHGEAMDPAMWEADALGLLYQADCHAHLGDESSARTCCARLPENFWTPGLHGAPAGDKAQIADQLRRMAADAKRPRT